MKTQEQIKEQIVKEMEELGYKAIPPMDFEVIDISEMNYDARRAYYQNITKLALEKEFAKVFEQLQNQK
jgi:hypothetical protein